MKPLWKDASNRGGRVCACLLGSLVSPAVLAQALGDLRVPDYLTTEPLTRTAPQVQPGGDPSQPFRNLPGTPFQGPVMPGVGRRAQGFTHGFFGGLETTYTDNAVLGSGFGGSGDDLLVVSTLGLRVGYAITENSSLDVNLGVSYRYSMNYRSFTQVNLVPNSFLSYRLLAGPVMLSFYNHSSSSANNRPELAGNGQAAAVNLNRISNSTGLTANWAPTADLSVSAGYAYTMDRGLDDSFGILDQDVHSLNAGVYERLSPYWTVGLSSGVQFSSFSQGFQNDSTSYSAGPLVSFAPNPYITLTGSVRYQISDFSTGGAVRDSHNFKGLVWNFTASQVLTKTISHSATVASGANTGLGSNFTENLSASYQLGWRFMKEMALNASFSYTETKQSGRQNGLFIYEGPNGLVAVPVTVTSNDTATLYEFMVSTSYQITDRLRSSLGYSYRLRDSAFQGRGYHANMVTLGLGFNF